MSSGQHGIGGRRRVGAIGRALCFGDLGGDGGGECVEGQKAAFAPAQLKNSENFARRTADAAEKREPGILFPESPDFGSWLYIQGYTCEIGHTPIPILCARKKLPTCKHEGKWMNALTSREREIIQILASSGLSNKDVGRRLNLSEGTVKVHLHNIYQKLGVKTRTALVALAHSELLSMERSLHASLPREEFPTDLTPSWLMSPCPYLEGDTGLCDRGRDVRNDNQKGGRTLILEQN